MPLEQTRLTTEIVKWDVDTVPAGRDLTGATVAVALVAAGVTPVPGDWTPAVLQDPAGTDRRIELLIGPDGGAADFTGDRQSWTKITANPETIVRRKGVITRT